jgi:hypothetical protein
MTMRTALLGSTSARALFAPLAGMRLMQPAFAPEDDDPGGDPPNDTPGETIDKAVHDRIVAAHEALKRDSRRDRQELRDARARIADLEQELETERSKHDDGNDKAAAIQAAVQAERTKYDKDVGARDKKIADLEAELNDTAADAALERALDEHRIKPELRRAAKALLRGDIEVEFEEGQGRHVYMNNLPVADAVKAWAESDDGKAFVLDGNSGGGAPGGRQSNSGKNPWKADQRNLTEQDRIEKKDPALASRLKAEAGVA